MKLPWKGSPNPLPSLFQGYRILAPPGGAPSFTYGLQKKLVLPSKFSPNILPNSIHGYRATAPPDEAPSCTSVIPQKAILPSNSSPNPLHISFHGCRVIFPISKSAHQQIFNLPMEGSLYSLPPDSTATDVLPQLQPKNVTTIL
jgi:hypothetical protein